VRLLFRPEWCDKRRIDAVVDAVVVLLCQDMKNSSYYTQSIDLNIFKRQ